MKDRSQLRLYADAVTMWMRGYDTYSIARETKVPEQIVERWVWKFRETARALAS
jgi:hypothetical protein